MVESQKLESGRDETYHCCVVLLCNMFYVLPYERRHEKNRFLPMRKQRHRSAVQ